MSENNYQQELEDNIRALRALYEKAQETAPPLCIGIRTRQLRLYREIGLSAVASALEGRDEGVYLPAQAA